VEENVMLTGGSATEAREALRLVGADQLVFGSKNVVVGPGGRTMSGGERRQIALARALATGLPMLIVDEPTEGLDSDAACAVRTAIARLRGLRTVLITTHDQRLVEIADRVVPVGASEPQN
jgi:ABC-type transport system involved in cytochrome bd biosynthesis fused ATPase/permease subunit